MSQAIDTVDRRTADRMVRRISYPTLGISLVGALVLGAGLHFWHEFQVDRTASSLLQRAESFAEIHDWHKAADYAYRYLALNPASQAARQRLAEYRDSEADYCHQPDKAQAQRAAIHLYYRALIDAPKNQAVAIRERLAALLLATGQPAEAEAQIDQCLALLEASEPTEAETQLLAQLEAGQPEDAQARIREWLVQLKADRPAEAKTQLRQWLASLEASKSADAATQIHDWLVRVASARKLRGLALYAQFTNGIRDKNLDDRIKTAVVKRVGQAWNCNRGDLQLAPILAELYRNHAALVSAEHSGLAEDDPKLRADEFMDQAVAKFGTTEAFLARFAYRRKYQLPGAPDDLEKALALDPADPEVLRVATEDQVRQTNPKANDKASQERLAQAEVYCLRLLKILEATRAAPGKKPAKVKDPEIDYELSARLGLAEVYGRQGLTDRRIDVLEQGLPLVAENNKLGLELTLAEALIDGQRFDDANELLNRIETEFARLSLPLTRPQRRQLQRQIALLRIVQHLGRGERKVAIEKLQAIVRNARGNEQSSAELQRGWMLLGAVLATEGRWDESATAYNEVANLDGQLAAAFAWSSASRPELAIERFQKLFDATKDPNVAILLASALFQVQWQLAEPERNWSRFNAVFQQFDDPAVVAQLTQPWRIERLQAMLLVQRDGPENQTRAIEILERLVADSAQVEPNDRLVLAYLLERQSRASMDPVVAKLKMDAARQQLIALTAPEKPQLMYLSKYIEFLLRRKETEEACVQLSRLTEQLADTEVAPDLLAFVVNLHIECDSLTEAENLLGRLAMAEPDSFRWLSLQARLLARQDRKADIEPLLTQWAARTLETVPVSEQLNRLRALGMLFGSHDLFPQAEHWLRQAQAISSDTYPALALVLAKLGKTDEARQLCLDAWKPAPDAKAVPDASPRPALVLTSLIVSVPGMAANAEVESLLENVLRRHPNHFDLLLSMSTLRIAQQRTEEAIRLLREALRVKSDHPIALNNLATLLAEEPSTRQEALERIDEAIGLVGPTAALLDTKGNILIEQGKAAEARPILEWAVANNDSDPRVRFHLAVSYHEIGERERAQEEFRRAQDAGLERQILTASDQRWLAILKSAVDLNT